MRYRGAHVSYVLPDGRVLLYDVSFRVGEGITGALVGPKGTDKSTLLRLMAGARSVGAKQRSTDIGAV